MERSFFMYMVSSQAQLERGTNIVVVKWTLIDVLVFFYAQLAEMKSCLVFAGVSFVMSLLERVRACHYARQDFNQIIICSCKSRYWDVGSNPQPGLRFRMLKAVWFSNECRRGKKTSLFFFRDEALVCFKI